MEDAISKRSNNRSPWEQQTLINDLKQGRELAKQLKNHLNPSTTASIQTRQFLVEKIISCYEKTLTKLNSPVTVPVPSRSKFNGNSTTSPLTHSSNHQLYNTQKAPSKKRKALPKWTEQVQVKSDTGLEGPLDDGHGWRKYGQKDILGAIHPRGYYRCTHRYVHGCLATKQVQRSDEDQTVFHVTYIGQHTCTKAAVAAHSTAASLNIQQRDASHEEGSQEKRIKLDQFRFSFGARTKNEDTSSLAFPIFSSFAMPDDDQFMSAADQNGCFSPFYTTSDSEFLQPCNSLSQLNVDVSESELIEAGSCLNSVSNSPMGVLDLDFDFPTGSSGLNFDSFLSDFLDFE